MKYYRSLILVSFSIIIINFDSIGQCSFLETTLADSTIRLADGAYYKTNPRPWWVNVFDGVELAINGKGLDKLVIGAGVSENFKMLYFSMIIGRFNPPRSFSNSHFVKYILLSQEKSFGKARKDDSRILLEIETITTYQLISNIYSYEIYAKINESQLKTILRSNYSSIFLLSDKPGNSQFIIERLYKLNRDKTKNEKFYKLIECILENK